MKLRRCACALLLVVAPVLGADDWKLLYNRGATALEAGDAREAIVCLEKARSLEPGDPTVLYGLVTAYFAGGRTASALAISRELLAAPFDVLMASGRLLLSRGYPAQAAEFLNRGGGNAPPGASGEIEQLLASVMAQSNQDDEAIRRMEALLAKEPGDPEHYYALGLLLIGIHNAWDTVTYIVVNRPGASNSEEARSPIEPRDPPPAESP